MKSNMKFNIGIGFILTCCLSLWTCVEGNEFQLLNYRSQFVMGMGEQAQGFYLNKEEFIKPYISFEDLGDSLRVSTLQQVNSCGDTKGKISISNDTLYLLVENDSEVECSSVEYWKYTYIIQKGKNVISVVKY